MSERRTMTVIGALRVKSGLEIVGVQSADEIYVVAGEALSRWESAEDQLTFLYRVLLREEQPMAFSAYVRANRSIRTKMLKDAVATYPMRLGQDDASRIETALKSMDRLAPTRNEIAHGRCVTCETFDPTGRPEASGIFLVPSWHEGEWMERSFRYAHNPETIRAFISAVKDCRTEIEAVTHSLGRAHAAAAGTHSTAASTGL